MESSTAGTEGVEVVLANNDRVTLRVGEVFLKVDSDQTRTDVEVEAMTLAPVPTPKVLWRNPPALALAALPGRPIAEIGDRSQGFGATWKAIGAALRTLHDAPLPPWPGKSPSDLASRLAAECEWLVANAVLPAELIDHNRQLAEVALRPWTPAFIHGDLHDEHIFVDGDEVTGIIDWSEACQGDPLFDLAVVTLGDVHRLDSVIAGYGARSKGSMDADVDREVISGWWSWRCLTSIRWLSENGYGEPEDYPEVAVLRANT